MKFNTKFKFILSLSLVFIICFSNLFQEVGSLRASNVETSDASSDKVNAAAASEAARHKTKKAKKSIATAQAVSKEAAAGAPTFNATNNTLTASLYKQLNLTFVKQDLATFKDNNRKWVDNKLFDKQLEDIYQDMLYQSNQDHSPASTRASIQIFTTAFEKCDSNSDNVLNFTEFSVCMTNDTYLKDIVPPPAMFATYSNYTNATGFYPVLFNVLDSYNTGYLNFHDYMILRLMIFSWRKCSVLGPFIEEISFECAIEIASNWKTMSRTTSRKIYLLALELSNSVSARNLDFIPYFIVAVSVRLYGKLNNKEDSDATKSEFALALDSNYLPSRYNQDIINQMFALVEEYNKPAQGMDIVSFCYYDFVLRLFDNVNATQRYYMNSTEFTNVIANNYLFPNGILREISLIPSNNITANSYQMYAYLNISNYHQESDHFVKFLQKTEKKAKATFQSKRLRIRQSTTTSASGSNITSTSSYLFKIIDGDNDGYINYYDFGNFFQIAYFFDRLDKNNKGYILCGDLHDAFTTYSEYPAYNYKIRERAKRFNLLNQDIFLDLQRTTLMLKLEDIVSKIVRRSDPTTLYEYELKSIFSQVNLANVPQSHVDKCLRGTDDNNVPRYDWECATLEAITMTANYYDWAVAYKTMQSQNLTMANTVFVNPDPALAN